MKLLLYFAAYHVVLSAFHKLFWMIKDKTESKVDDNVASVLDWLITINNWIMGNRRNPITREEVRQANVEGMSHPKDP